jgi:hypothetical protein
MRNFLSKSYPIDNLSKRCWLSTPPTSISIIVPLIDLVANQLVFGIAFWNSARTVSYEKKIRTSMLISGWGDILVICSKSGYNATNYSLSPYWTSNYTDIEIDGVFGTIGDLQQTCVGE